MISISQSIIWSPIHHAIEKRINTGDKLLLVISPFIKHGALDRLISTDSFTEQTKVIVRWQPSDLLNSVSDLSIYPLLNDLGVPLYRHENIHLKLYIFESNIAFHSSGNLTERGFGYSDQRNVEIGSFSDLSDTDWSNIYALIGQSRLMDDALYSQFEEYERDNKLAKAKTASLKLEDPEPQPFSTSSFPAVKSPEEFIRWYLFGVSRDDPEVVRRFIHDIDLYSIPSSLENAKLEEHLRTSFTTQPFVLGVVDFIRQQGSVRFGGINDWIHSNCADVPLPYKWEIKDTTNTLYNWLEYFFDEISWDVPGQRSQVVYWKDE